MCILLIMAFYRKGLYLFLCFDYFMMFIYESNGCIYSSRNEINICSAGSTSGTRIGIRNKNVPNDKVVQCVCDLQTQTPTNFTAFFDGPGYNTCGTSVILFPNRYSCFDYSTNNVLATATRLFFKKSHAENDEWCIFFDAEEYAVNITCYDIGEEPPEGTTKFSSTLQPTLLHSTTSNSRSSAFPSTNLRTSPSLTQTSKPPPSTPPPKTTTPSTTQITTSLTTSSTLQSLLTPSKTSTREPKDPDSSLGTTLVFKSNITITKTFSTTAIALISIGFGLFVTVSVPVVVFLALKCMRSCKQKEVDHTANVQMSNIGNNFNPETNSDLQTFPDTDSLRYETHQNRTANINYTNLQMSTITVDNQTNHLQPLYVGDFSTGRRNENVSATMDYESHYQNSSSQPFSMNSSAQYESLNPNTDPLSDHCYSTLQT